MARSDLRDDRCPKCRKVRRDAGFDRIRIFETFTLVDDILGEGVFYDVKCLGCGVVSRELFFFQPFHA